MSQGLAKTTSCPWPNLLPQYQQMEQVICPRHAGGTQQLTTVWSYAETVPGGYFEPADQSKPPDSICANQGFSFYSRHTSVGKAWERRRPYDF